MKKCVRLMLIAMLCLGVVCLGGCGGKDTPQDNTVGSADNGKQETLKMGTNAEFNPFEYKEGTNFLGIDVEISQAIADKLGMKLEIVDMDFDSLLDALSAGTVDFVAAGMTVDPEREQNADFTVPYFNASQTVIVAKDNNKITDAASLKGLKIGVQAGTTGNDLSDKIENATVSAFTTGAEAVSALKNGTVDAVIIDNFPAQAFLSKNEGLKVVEGLFENEQYAMAVKKGNKELFDKINNTFTELIESGEVDKIIAKYSSSLVG